MLRVVYPAVLAVYPALLAGGEDLTPKRRDSQRFAEFFFSAFLCVSALSPGHYGTQHQETGWQKSERIVEEAIERLAWAEDQLWARRKGHRANVLLARRLRQETTISLKWIAERLHLGSWTCVSNLLNEQPQIQPEAQEELRLCQ